MPNINDIEMGDDEENTFTNSNQNAEKNNNPRDIQGISVSQVQNNLQNPQQNQVQNNLQNPQQSQNFSENPNRPIINTARDQQNQVPYSTFSQPNPSAPASDMPSQAVPAQTSDLKKTNNSQNIKPVNLKARKRAILGCFVSFFFVLILLLVFSFIFIANSESASDNPIAKLLNVNATSFVNGLITFIHIIFLLTALGIFLITMMGFVKIITAKKDDKEAKKIGVKISLISGIILMFFLIIWLFSFVYLDGKRIIVDGPVLMPIITTPEDTINLEAPILIKFDATNVPYDEKNWQIISYSWSFGDKTTGTGVVVSKTYTEKGRFDVLLEVTRRNKNTNQEQVDTYPWLVTISGSKMEAIIIAEPLSGEVPLKVSFDASRSVDLDNQVVQYEWDFDGDLSFDDAKGAKVEYTFDKVGKYKVSLRIINAIGDYEISEIEIEALDKEVPEAVIEITGNPTFFEQGRQYLFSADKSSSKDGRIVSYEWDFGDGKPVVRTRTTSHTYDKEGVYKLKLIVKDDKGREGEVEREIQVGLAKGMPKAEFQTDLLQGRAPLEVTFDGSLSTDPDNNIIQYEWDFDGDGVVDAFNVRTKYTYREAGEYTATLKVTDADGHSSTATQVIKVLEQGIVVDLKSDKIDGTVPLTVQFDASGSSYANGQITSYRWDFGDKTAPKLGASRINHRYDQVGTYTATVEVIASDNTTAKKEMLITVREVALFSCFVSVFKEGPAPLTTSFDPACSTGTISRYFWNFGDGTTSSELKPTHTFERAGDYTVSLEVSDIDNTIDRSEVLIKVLE